MNSVGATIGRKLERAAAELRTSQRHAVNAAALRLTTEVRQEIARASGGDSRLSRVGTRGARVGARYDVRGDNNPSALVRATGPLHILERPTKPHRIEPKTRGRGANRRQRAGAVRLADGSFRRSIPHPGTRGKYPFRKGIERGKPWAERILRNATTDAVKRGLRA